MIRNAKMKIGVVSPETVSINLISYDIVFPGPCKMYQTATITMNDNFHPHVTWRNPANRHQGTPNLTHITRDQSFYVWLVAWNMTAQRAYILKTVSWNMQLDINIEPTKSLGK